MISVTMLSSYIYCPRKLYLERVLGLFEPPKESLVKGSIRHETYDLINKNEERIVKSFKEKTTLEKIKETYKYEYLKFLRLAVLKNKEGLNQFDLKPEDIFRQTFPLINEEAENRSWNIYQFMEKNNLFGDELWEKLTPKIISEFKISSDNLGLKGIIDQIEVYGDDFVPIELKTGKMPKEGVWPGHKIQLAAYALLIEEFYKKEVKEGFVAYLDAKERRHISINPFLRIEVKELITKVNTLLACSEAPEICANQNKCSVCGLKQDCFDDKTIEKLSKSKDNKKPKVLNIS